MPESAPSRRDITVIGASAGGLEALRTLVASLPADYPAAGFIVMHMAADRRAPCPKSFSVPRSCASPLRMTARRSCRAKSGSPCLTCICWSNRAACASPAVRARNRYRPAIDTLFRSAALAYGSRVTAEQKDNVEAALWAAMRALEEGANIARRLADHAHRSGRLKSAQAFIEGADDNERHAQQIRHVLRVGVDESTGMPDVTAA